MYPDFVVRMGYSHHDFTPLKPLNRPLRSSLPNSPRFQPWVKILYFLFNGFIHLLSIVLFFIFSQVLSTSTIILILTSA